MGCFVERIGEMSFFPPNNILEEEIVTRRNLDPDCEAIGHLLERFGEKFILSALEDAQYSIAVDNYLQMLDSLTEHFIADEHWCWFDDFYSPDYTVSRIWDEFIPHIRSGALAGEPLAELESGLKLIEQSEAYQKYGIPSMIPFSGLKNSKTFLERCSGVMSGLTGHLRWPEELENESKILHVGPGCASTLKR